ncbi:hypothetical protein PHACT_10125 [Pseudohongiella acticola]|uniref:Uncharacterized protein n=1 Tax=Pseudohongiella acticola TaxID=1524254 RepID=A0A1E8CLZ0_9GAMM|nr:hypothetical protein PHACT_10125 [Pseudohongiella acticola]
MVQVARMLLLGKIEKCSKSYFRKSKRMKQALLSLAKDHLLPTPSEAAYLHFLKFVLILVRMKATGFGSTAGMPKP